MLCGGGSCAVQNSSRFVVSRSERCCFSEAGATRATLKPPRHSNATANPSTGLAKESAVRRRCGQSWLVICRRVCTRKTLFHQAGATRAMLEPHSNANRTATARVAALPRHAAHGSLLPVARRSLRSGPRVRSGSREQEGPSNRGRLKILDATLFEQFHKFFLRNHWYVVRLGVVSLRCTWTLSDDQIVRIPRHTARR